MTVHGNQNDYLKRSFRPPTYNAHRARPCLAKRRVDSDAVVSYRFHGGSQENESSPPPPPPPVNTLLRLRQHYVRRGTPSPPPPSSSRPLRHEEPAVVLGQAKHFCEQLKMESDDYGNSRSVQFHPVVSVVEIPSRTAYSPITASSLWNQRAQIRRNAARNMLEYAFEKYSWREAMEEDQFFQYGSKMLHPAHFLATLQAPRQGHSSSCRWEQENDETLARDQQVTV